MCNVGHHTNSLQLQILSHYQLRPTASHVIPLDIMSSTLFKSPSSTPFHPKRRSACDRCHKQKLKCAKLAGQQRCIPCTRSKKLCEFSPALGTSLTEWIPIANREMAETEMTDCSLLELVEPDFTHDFWPVSQVEVPLALPRSTQQGIVEFDGVPGSTLNWENDSLTSSIEAVKLPELLGLKQSSNSEQPDETSHASPENLIRLAAQLAEYRQSIPKEMINWAPIQNCPQHGGPFPGAEPKVCLDCICETFEMYRIFDFAEHLVRLQSHLFREGAASGELEDPSTFFLLISCHHNMISTWEIVAYQLCYVVHKLAQGELPPSANKNCAFLKMGTYMPSSQSVLALYCAFFRDTAKKLGGCLEHLGAEFSTHRDIGETGKNYIENQMWGVSAAVVALHERGKSYYAVLDKAEKDAQPI